MKLLVTGGAGFIGANFIHYWVKNHPQDEIINLDKLTYAGNRDNLIPVADNPHYHFVKGDICDQNLVNKLMKGVDYVVHFAAESHVDRSLANPTTFIQTNVLGTYILLEAALRAKIKRFHHISTDEVFGALSLRSRKKFNEKTNYFPQNPYSATKAAADHLVRAFYHSWGLPITISNCSNNYGPYQHPEKFIPRAITNLLIGKKIPIYGDGKYVRDWLYVQDHCRAIELILIKGKPGETYCIGGLIKEIDNLALAKMICFLMEKDPDNWIEFVPDRPGHDRRYAVDWRKIKKELGWQPSMSLEKGLKKTIKWYQDYRWWWQSLKEKTEQFYCHLRRRR